MPVFEIEFEDDATADNIVKLERALKAIGPGPVQQEDGHFTATLKWGTDQRSLNNLLGKLNGSANNIVTSVSAIGEAVRRAATG
jgi:hypothetical protein